MARPSTTGELPAWGALEESSVFG